MVQIVVILCKNEHVRIHIQTPRNTTLNHPSTHSDNDTDLKHHKSLHFPFTSGSVSKVFVSSFAHPWMRSTESLLVNKGMGRGSSWSSLDVETLESDVSSGKSAGAIAKDRGWPSSSVRQSVAAIKRGDPPPRHVGGCPRRLTPELLDEIREEEHGRISLKIVSNRFTLSRTCSRKAIRLLRLRPLVIRTVPHLQDRHIRDRRKFAEEMLARLALPSGKRISRKISSSRRLNLDVTCFSDHILLVKVCRRDKATSLFGIHHAKKVGRIVTSVHFSATFHDTSLRGLHGHSSPQCCWTHVVEPLQEERRHDHSRSWPVHWPGLFWPRVPSVLHPA